MINVTGRKEVPRAGMEIYSFVHNILLIHLSYFGQVFRQFRIQLCPLISPELRRASTNFFVIIDFPANTSRSLPEKFMIQFTRFRAKRTSPGAAI